MEVMARGATFGVLGPLHVSVEGRAEAVTAPRQRVVLATLLLAEGRPVSAGELADVIWGDLPPRSARVTVQNYVKRLRAALGPDRIETTAEGYRVAVGRDDVDLFRFRD